MSQPLRAAVVGAGVIAHQHLGFLQRDPDVALLGICDRSRALGQWCADRFGGTWFADVDEMLRVVEPDVVHVLTPPASHVPLATAALGAGAHVVVEKPLAATERDCVEILHVADQARRKLLEVQNYRFNDPTQEIVDRILDGRLGELVEVEVRLALDFTADPRFSSALLDNPVAHLKGGAIRDFLPHAAGLVLYLANLANSSEQPATEVAARWWNRRGLSTLAYDEMDAVMAIGAVAGRVRISSLTKPEGFRVIARGSGGSIEVDLFQPNFVAERARDGGALSPLTDQVRAGAQLIGHAASGLRNKVLQRTPYHGLDRLLSEFYTSIRTGAPSPISPRSIIDTAFLVDSISAEAGS